MPLGAEMPRQPLHRTVRRAEGVQGGRSVQDRRLPAGRFGAGEDEIKAESAFIEDLGADSLDIVELVMAMEEEFEVEIPDEEAEHIKTVQDAINFINEHKK